MISPAQVVGTTVASRYRLERVFGRGAMGTVFRAVHARLGRPLAIKILNPSSDAALVARFQREAEVLGKLHHPNVVTVVDVGEADGLRLTELGLVLGTPHYMRPRTRPASRSTTASTSTRSA